ncbi:hydroxypyruvate isomerase [Kribbella sp. VKM Ac-2527]|uniref:Hydroxypyruvate isomerase n=1 Tax=Kribbella caucasensis TaxID=2512215 RepID=A0A4R6KJG3_9ACTN|nr:TIM barrel protein [Kribbella sp. VKM Ac-2527]TDO51447.1 hydroxypyruvate isomerase [Kribbella sp. VKM Ac-2527]
MRLAVCAEMVFTDLPFLERVERVHAAGFQVEIWNWTTKDIPALRQTGAEFSSMTGYVSGSLTHDQDELLKTAAQSIEVALELGCPRLNLHGTELGEGGLPVVPQYEVTGEMWLTAARTLEKLAVMAERAGVMFVLENLNTEVDHPGVPFAKARDTLALVQAVDHPHLRLNLDLYHAQIGEGNLIALLEKALPYIGEIQIADVPGRREPGTGEINYPAIAAALRNLNYTGTIALEAFAESNSDLALRRFQTAFANVET